MAAVVGSGELAGKGRGEGIANAISGNSGRFGNAGDAIMGPENYLRRMPTL